MVYWFIGLFPSDATLPYGRGGNTPDQPGREHTKPAGPAGTGTPRAKAVSIEASRAGTPPAKAVAHWASRAGIHHPAGAATHHPAGAGTPPPAGAGTPPPMMMMN